MIDIKGLDKAEILVELYNHSHQKGIGIFAARKELSVEDARELLKNQTSFDYLYGKVMKVDLSSDLVFDETLYEIDNGKGKCQNIIDKLKETKKNREELTTDDMNIEVINTNEKVDTIPKYVNNNESMSIAVSKPKNKIFDNLDITLDRTDKNMADLQALLVEFEGNPAVLVSSVRGDILLKDLNGNVLKKVLPFSRGGIPVMTPGIPVMTRDNDCLYVFFYNARYGYMYTININTFNPMIEKNISETSIQSACCNDNRIYTFNMGSSAEIQERDKNGNVLQRQQTSSWNRRLVALSDGVSSINNYKPGDLSELSEIIGEELIKLNESISDFTYDELNDTYYVSYRNIVVIYKDNKLKGVIYRKDKDITEINYDKITNSFSITYADWPEESPVFPHSGGGVEIFSMSLMEKKIQESLGFLQERKKGEVVNLILDISNKDLDIVSFFNDQMKKDVFELYDFLRECKIKNIYGKNAMEAYKEKYNNNSLEAPYFDSEPEQFENGQDYPGSGEVGKSSM